MKAPAEVTRPGQPVSAPAPALVAGYLVWLLATLLIAFLASKGAWEAITNCWLLAFLAGAAVCFLMLSIQGIRSRSGALPLLDSFGAYALPVALLVVGWEAVGTIFRSPARDQAFHATAPLAMLLASGLGLLFGCWLARRRGRDFLVGAVLPPAIMAVATVGYFAFGTLTSDDFRYRDAFAFGVVEATREGGQWKAECLLTIRKPGEYVYTVSPLVGDHPEESDLPGKIAWADGGVAPVGVTGDFKVTLSWPGEDTVDGPIPSSSPYFAIRHGDGDSGRILQAFPIPIGDDQGP